MLLLTEKVGAVSKFQQGGVWNHNGGIIVEGKCTHFISEIRSGGANSCNAIVVESKLAQDERLGPSVISFLTYTRNRTQNLAIPMALYNACLFLSCCVESST